MAIYRDWVSFLPALLVLAEFALLLALGFVFMRLIYWHSLLNDNREQWLAQCQAGARQLRVLRRQMAIAEGSWTRLPLSPHLRKKLSVIRWVGRAVKLAGAARP